MSRKNSYTKTTNLFKIIFLLIVFLGIGYAFLDATLNINGDVTVEAPEFNTYVQSTSVTSGSTAGTPTIIGNDKKEVDFTTALTSDGSSFFEETTTVINKGTKKAYLLGVDVKVYDSSNNEITLAAPYEYTVTKGDGSPIQIGEQIGIGNTETFKFKFNYISGTDMTTVTEYPTYIFKITYNYVVKIPVSLPAGKTKDNLTVGDEICILDQCFNFIKYDGTDNDIVMLAKYNLKVGDIFDNNTGTKSGEYVSTDLGYGLQDVNVRGYVTGETYANGTVAFSTTNYWNGNISSYPADVYDAKNYATAPGTNTYSVAYYVEQYKDKLMTNYGQTIKSARLLTYSEVTDSSIGCVNFSTCPTTGDAGFISYTTFWLGTSASDYGAVYDVYSNGNLYNYLNDINYSCGVRPVIVISKSNI